MSESDNVRVETSVAVGRGANSDSVQLQTIPGRMHGRRCTGKPISARLIKMSQHRSPWRVIVTFSSSSCGILRVEKLITSHEHKTKGHVAQTRFSASIRGCCHCSSTHADISRLRTDLHSSET